LLTATFTQHSLWYPESWIPLQQYYYEEIKEIKFWEINKSLEKNFKEINQKNNQKRSKERSSKSLLPIKFISR